MSTPRPSFLNRLCIWRRRVMARLRQDETERQLAEELAFHVDMEARKHARAGMPEHAARTAALRSFGSIGRVSEQVRAVRKIAWVEDLFHDLRHAARGFRRSPGFTAAAIAALSLGIGANAAVFSVVHAVVFAPLPYAEPERLVRLWESNPVQGVELGAVSPGTFVDLRDRTRSLERVAVFTERDFLISTETGTWETHAAAVSPNMFDMLGVRPVIGASFDGQTDPSLAGRDHNRAVISHALWLSRFGGDSSVIGRFIQVDYRFTYLIMGVMPPGFSYPVGASVWTTVEPGNVTAATRQFRYYGAIAQLRRGHTLEQAQREATAIARQLEAEHPAANAGWTMRMMPLHRSIVGDTRTTLIILLALAGCVLLVACGNVATLAVARATARRHETAVRVALGAGTRRLLRQWMAEGLLLALLGGAGGILVGYWCTRALLTVAPPGIPRLDEVAFDGPVLAFVVLATIITGLLVGLAPALRIRTGNPHDALRSRAAAAGAAGAAGARTREWLVGGQVALTMILTVAATLLLRSFERLQSTDLGYRRHDILSAEVDVPLGRFAREARRVERARFYESLIADIEAIPGVRSVAGTTTIPLTGEILAGNMWRVDAPGASGANPPASAADQWKAGTQIITPRYFETMGIHLVRGRGFESQDRFGPAELTVSDSIPRPPGVAVINEAMAKEFFPEGDALGQRIILFDDRAYSAYRTIVGIVRDTRSESHAAAPSPTVYLPFAQHPVGGGALSLVLRTDLPPEQLVATVTARLRAFDPAVSVSSVRPFDEVIGGALARPRFTMLLVGTFAALALLIAAVGVFGIVGFLVTRRTHEIGIRMALGARPGSVLWLVLRDGLQPVLLGAAVGCAGAVAAANAMQALLYDIAPLDSVSFLTAAALLLAAAIIAAFVPASRAAGLDPLRSLRVE